jgi:hypothetical protein
MFLIVPWFVLCGTMFVTKENIEIHLQACELVRAPLETHGLKINCNVYNNSERIN